MTTIVRHRRTGNQYILLSINPEENKTNPSRFINELFNAGQEKSAVSCSATVCDVQGNLFLAYIDDLIVVEMDGKKPADILPEPEYSEPEYNSIDNDDYRQPISDFDDEELEDEDFDRDNFDNEDEDSKRVIITPNPESSTYDRGVSEENDFDEDDEEWI